MQKPFLTSFLIGCYCLIAFQLCPCGFAAEQKPNIILINCDNLGYGDIEPFGSTLHRTPRLNQLAESGRKFTHFYSASGVCTPSRAALMTGCYPQRVDMSITDGAVLRPVSPIGLNPQEWTMAEHLQEAGYATAMFGKWHLGDQPPFLPTRQGFQFFMGIPYSDDMTYATGQRLGDRFNGKLWPPLPLMHNETVLEAPTDRNLLAQKLTTAACDWMEEHQNERFFLYFPQCMPGSTQAPYASEDFRGKSKNGPWGDSIEEIDWSLGMMLNKLDQLQLTEKTLVIWTSDNGAPRRNPVQGRNDPLGGWGYSTSEGGMRVPCIMSWPGQIPAGTVCEELCTMMDLYPTFAALSQHPLKTEPKRDGYDISSLMLAQTGATTPYQAFYYYQMDQLQAVRSGPWKLFLKIDARSRTTGGKSTTQMLQLYNVVNDPGENQNLATQHPEIVSRLQSLAEVGRKELGDHQSPSNQVRPHATITHPQPLLKTAASDE